MQSNLQPSILGHLWCFVKFNSFSVAFFVCTISYELLSLNVIFVIVVCFY